PRVQPPSVGHLLSCRSIAPLHGPRTDCCAHPGRAAARTLDGLLHGLQMGSARPATRLSAPQTRPEGTRPRNAVDNSVDKSSSALWIMLWISRDVEGGGDCGGLKRSRFRTRSESYPQCAESLSVRRSNHYAGVSRSRSAAAPRTA